MINFLKPFSDKTEIFVGQGLLPSCINPRRSKHYLNDFLLSLDRVPILNVPIDYSLIKNTKKRIQN